MSAASRLPTVCILDDWDGVAHGVGEVERLREVAEVIILTDVGEDELLSAAARAQVIVPMRERRAIDASLLDKLPELEHIAQTGGGAAHVDQAALEARGITLSLTPGASAGAVAELVLGLIIAAERGLLAGAQALREGRWQRPLGRDLAGLRLAIVGAGATGSAVAERAGAMGMEPLLWSRRPGVGLDLGLDEVVAQADVLTVHVESSPATSGLISRRHLRDLGPRGGFVNTARASIVDGHALLGALESGDLGWAALDVFDQEPPGDDPLIAHGSVLATPHLGWRTHQTLERYLAGALRNARAHLTGQPVEPSSADAMNIGANHA